MTTSPVREPAAGRLDTDNRGAKPFGQAGLKQTKPSNYGLIVAAGSGRRFGGLKQFALLKGEPLVAYSLRAFENCSAVRGIVVVTNRAEVERTKELVHRRRFRKVLAVVAGGRRRGDSVRRGLAALPERGYVAVHDGARPLVSPSVITRGFRLCRTTGPVACGHRVTDTVKRVFSGRIIETVDRSSLYCVQTPQFFSLPLLRRAHAAAVTAGTAATDDCALVELLGIRPRVFPGPATNIKVTTPEDLKLAGRLL